MVIGAEVMTKVLNRQEEWATYPETGQVRAIEMPNLPVVDDISTVLGMSTHRTSAVALVEATIDLFRCKPKSSSQSRRWFEHDCM